MREERDRERGKRQRETNREGERQTRAGRETELERDRQMPHSKFLFCFNRPWCVFLKTSVSLTCGLGGFALLVE